MRPDGGSDMVGVNGWLPGMLPGLEYGRFLLPANMGLPPVNKGWPLPII